MGLCVSKSSPAHHATHNATHNATHTVRHNVRQSLDLACHYALSMMSPDITVYHNYDHAKDVADFTQVIMKSLKPEYSLDANTEKCMTAAALMHDVCHPAGKSNDSFHKSVAKSMCGETDHLETIHASIAIVLMRNTQSFVSLGEEKQKKNYAFIEKIIHATDMKTYFEEEADPKIALCKLIIRCADLSHFTKDSTYHLQNVQRLNTEIGTVMTPQSNVKFIQVFVVPLYKNLHKYCYESVAEQWMEAINEKLLYWMAKH